MYTEAVHVFIDWLSFVVFVFKLLVFLYGFVYMFTHAHVVLLSTLHVYLFIPLFSLSLSLQVESKQLVHGRIFDIVTQRGRGGTYLRLLVNFNEDTISLYKEVGGQ